MLSDIHVYRRAVASVPAAVAVSHLSAAAATHSHAETDTNADALHHGAGWWAAVRRRRALVNHFVRRRPAPRRRVDHLALGRRVVDALLENRRDYRVDRRGRSR